MVPNRKDPLFWPTRAKEYYIYVLSKEQSEAKDKAAMFKCFFFSIKWMPVKHPACIISLTNIEMHSDEEENREKSMIF